MKNGEECIENPKLKLLKRFALFHSVIEDVKRTIQSVDALVDLILRNNKRRVREHKVAAADRKRAVFVQRFLKQAEFGTVDMNLGEIIAL